MAPKDERRRRDSKESPDEGQPTSAAKDTEGKKGMLLYVGIGGAIFLLVALTAVAGAYKAALAVTVPAPDPYAEDEEEVVPIIDATGRQTRLLDIARDKPLVMSGDPFAIAPMQAGMSFPGRATADFKEASLEPEMGREVGRPFALRPSPDHVIHMPISGVSDRFDRAGRLGGNEPLERRAPAPLDDSETEPVIPAASFPEARTVAGGAISPSTLSTIPTPVGYTQSGTTYHYRAPEAVRAERTIPDLHYSENGAPIESNPRDESSMRGRVR